METYKKFDTLFAFERYLNDNPIRPNYQDGWAQASSREGNKKWYGTKTWDEARELFKKGDRKIAKAITGGVIKMTRKSHRDVARIETSVVGVAPHVANYIAGRPNAMINVVKRRMAASVVTCVYNISVNGGISSAEMSEAAIKMLSAIKIIEDSGTRVNLYLVDISKGNGDEIGWALRIKTSSQHLDILKTTYPLCNTSMLRRHSFRFTEVTPNAFGAGDYGYAVKDTTKLCKAVGIRDAVSVSFYDIKSSMTAFDIAEHIMKQAARPHVK